MGPAHEDNITHAFLGGRIYNPGRASHKGAYPGAIIPPLNAWLAGSLSLPLTMRDQPAPVANDFKVKDGVPAAANLLDASSVGRLAPDAQDDGLGGKCCGIPS